MNLRDASKGAYGLIGTSPTQEEVNCGSLQRIADACALMAQNWVALNQDLERYRRWYEESRGRITQRDKTITALRGVITRLKNRETK